MNQFAIAPRGPGGTRHFDMAGELGRLGIDVRIVASDLNLHTRSYDVRSSPRDPRPIREDVDGVTFHWLPAGSYAANDWRRLASMVVFAAAAGLFLVTRRLRRDDVLIGSSPHLFAAFATWMAARIRRRRFVFEVRDLWPESYTGVSGRTVGVDISIMRWMSDVLYRSADHVVVLAQGSTETVVVHGGDPARISWIPNGVDLVSFDVDRPSRGAGPIRFVYAGAHGPANGLDVAVGAAAEVVRMGRTDIELVLIGDGAVKADLIELARSIDAPVRFLEPVPKDEIPSVLASFDVGLMVLADVELFQFAVSPNKLFDYLACGLPVLTNVPGFVSDLVHDSRTGVTTSPGSAPALAAAMIEMADQILAGQGWADGREVVAERFDRRALAAQMARILRA